MKFTLSTEQVNKYGFRVLTSGIDLEAFKKNPVMLYNHQRSFPFNTERLLPIGKWENIAVENGNLVADAVFDENDEFAKSVKEKVEQGMLNAASIGFEPLTTSEDSADMIAGQTRPTVTKCSLNEASIVDIPGNCDAIAMNFREKGISLSGDISQDALNLVLPQIQKTEMKKIAAKLGLAADATEDQIVAALETQLSAKPDTDLEAQRDELVNALLSFGEANGTINEKNKESIKQLAKANLSATLSLINSFETTAAKPEAEKHVSLAAAVEDAKAKAAGSATVDANDKTKWSFQDWRKKDPKGLQLMQSAEPKKFEELFSNFKNTTV